MALESVDFSEEKALRILDIVLQEDKDSKKSDKEKKKAEHVSFQESGWVKSNELENWFAHEKKRKTFLLNALRTYQMKSKLSPRMHAPAATFSPHLNP